MPVHRHAVTVDVDAMLLSHVPVLVSANNDTLFAAVALELMGGQLESEEVFGVDYSHGVITASHSALAHLASPIAV